VIEGKKMRGEGERSWGGSAGFSGKRNGRRLKNVCGEMHSDI